MIARVYKCPTCAEKIKLKKRNDTKDGRHWQCIKGHNVKRSVRKITWLENSKLKMFEILFLRYM